VHCDKQVVICSVAMMYQLAVLLDHELTAIEWQFSSLRAMVSCVCSPTIRWSLASQLCCEGHANGNRQHSELM